MSITVQNNLRYELDKPLKHWALLWKAVRRDLTKFYWTNASETITFRAGGGVGGSEYIPGASLNVSAVRKDVEGARASAALRGAIVADHVEEDDVRAGLWYKTRITQYLINWRHPYRGAIFSSDFFVIDPKWDGEGFEFDVAGVSHFMQEGSGLYASRDCQNVFGGAFGKATSYVGCRFDIGADRKPFISVDSVTDNYLIDATTVFGESDGHWNGGYVEFTTGANTNAGKIRVDDYDATGGEIYELVRPAPFNIASGDLFTVSRGCEHTYADCEARSQTDNFRGFTHVPTEEDMQFTEKSRE